MAYHVRLIEKKDFKAVEELIKSFYREVHTEKSISKEIITKTIDELCSFPEKGSIYVFEMQNVIVGYMILIYYWSMEFGGNIVFIDEIFISPSYRNKNIGSNFLKTIIDRHIKSFIAIQLEVSPSNYKAQKFYEKNGFSYMKDKSMFCEFKDLI